jgi:hypothetical protein
MGKASEMEAALREMEARYLAENPGGDFFQGTAYSREHMRWSRERAKEYRRGFRSGLCTAIAALGIVLVILIWNQS